MITGAKTVRSGFINNSLAPKRSTNQRTFPRPELYKCFFSSTIFELPLIS